MRPSTPHHSEFRHEEHDPAPAAVVQLGRFAVLASVVVSPWFFGCILDSDNVYLFAVICGAAVLCAVTCWFRAILVPHAPQRVPLMLLPLLAVVCLGAVQLLPAEQTLVTGEIQRIDEFSGLDTGVEITSSRLSFFPDATRHEIVRGVLACLAFVAGFVLFRSVRSRTLLWGALALNGLALAGFGMAQQLSWNGKLFWRVPLSNGGVPFASFVNKNNAAAYLLISAAAAIGLLLAGKAQQSARLSWDSVVRFFAKLDTRTIAVLIALVAIGTGMVASRSRGGFLALVAAAAVVTLLEGRRRQSWTPVLAGLTTIGCVSLLAVSFEFSDVMQQRFARVAENEVTDDGRIKHWSDVIHVVSATPWVGTGLGSYRYATQPFLTETNQPWFAHADNQFVETAVEAGICGLILVVLLIGTGLWSGWQMSRAGAFAAGTVLVFLVTSQACHAVFDFGLILPATLVTAAVLAGSSAAAVSECRGVGVAVGRFVMPVLVTSGALLGAGCLTQSVAFADQETVLRETEHPLSLVQAEDSLTRVAAALKSAPGHAELHRRMAELHIARYEFAAAEQIRQRSSEFSDEQVSALSSISTLSLRIRDLRRAGEHRLVKSVLALEQVTANLPAARKHLSAALRSCPVLADCDTMLFELAPLSDLSAPAPANGFWRTIRLEPANEVALARIGPLGYRDPQLQPAAERCIQRALTSRDNLVVKRVVAATQFPDLAAFRRCLPRSMHSRFRVASVLSNTPSNEFARPLLSELLSQANTWETSVQADELPLILETLLRHDLDQECVDLCRRLATRHAGSAPIHYQLARSLLKCDRTHEALRAARVAAAIEPQNPRFSEFLTRLEKTSRTRTHPKSGS